MTIMNRVGYLRLALALGLSLLLLLGTGVELTAGESEEYRVKAAMIYNMIRFMDWPEEAAAGGNPRLRLCIAGNGPLAAAAAATLPEKQVKGKSIAVTPLAPGNGFAGCQILLFGELTPGATQAWLERTRSHELLTVGDSAGFTAAGGVVGFLLEAGKVRFEINQAAAQRQRIRISAQLLKLAKSVREAP